MNVNSVSNSSQLYSSQSSKHNPSPRLSLSKAIALSLLASQVRALDSNAPGFLAKWHIRNISDTTVKPFQLQKEGEDFCLDPFNKFYYNNEESEGVERGFFKLFSVNQGEKEEECSQSSSLAPLVISFIAVDLCLLAVAAYLIKQQEEQQQSRSKNVRKEEKDTLQILNDPNLDQIKEKGLYEVYTKLTFPLKEKALENMDSFLSLKKDTSDFFLSLKQDIQVVILEQGLHGFQEVKRAGSKHFRNLSFELQRAALKHPQHFASLIKNTDVFAEFPKLSEDIQMLLLIGLEGENETPRNVSDMRSNFKAILRKSSKSFYKMSSTVQSICIKNPGPFTLSFDKDILEPRFFDLDERVQLLFLSDKEDYSKARAKFSEMGEEALDTFFKSSLDEQIAILKR